MTLGELTTELQTLCHNGHATDEVCINLYDAMYKVGKVKLIGNILEGTAIKECFGITCEVEND